MENKEVNYIMCQTSTAHTFGNITAFIQNWLINLFPENLFKTVHVNSKIAHKQLRSGSKETLKKEKPIFAIRPRIDWNDSDRFLGNTLIGQRMTDMYHTHGATNLQEFIFDVEKEYAVKYQLNRHVMTFDVIMVFSTLMQQINWANYINNAVKIGIPMTLETCLESYLPIEMLEMISDITGKPIFDACNSPKDFLNYVNGKSLFPITYKMQGSSSTNEFYRFYPARIDTTITGFQTDEGEKTGQVMSAYQMGFSIRCEFWGSGFYYIFSDKIKKAPIMTIPDDATIIPVFTDVVNREDLNLDQGWSLYNSPTVRLDNDDSDTINLSQSVNESIRAVIKYHTDNGIPLDEFLSIKVRRQGKPLRSGVDFKFNPITCDLTFIKCSTFFTYKVLICINIEYVNDLIKQLYKLK